MKLLRRYFLFLMSAVCAFSFCFSAAAEETSSAQEQEDAEKPDTSRYLVVIDDEPDTVDFQCTTIYYTVAQNVFNRLVETENDADGNMQILPSLATSWEVSEDGRSYTFHLNKDVTFSNGSPLTSSDVLYTSRRLLTHPDSCNQDIVEMIKGAALLESGNTDQLEGFEILSDLDFVITLDKPFEAVLSCLSMPGASILDEETTEAAGDRFGKDAESTIGTGSFILQEWKPGEGMLYKANQDCWAGPPACEGVELRFLTESEAIRMMFERGELDILDLDDLDNSAEYFIHGDIYQDRLYQVQQIGTTYIALNEAVGPLTDVRVRRALQLALNRMVILDVVYSGRGLVENGIYPHGLYGFNTELPEIPYDPDEAKRLLKEAGYEDGFDLTIGVRSSATQSVVDLVNVAANMWEKIGVKPTIKVMDEEEFMKLRKNGKLACYAATWIADYNDPDSFIYTFFGNRDNTTYRSLCYSNMAVMDRVQKARGIPDPEERIREYQELEQIIAQEDAAWIPLFSRQRYYVISDRLEGFRVSWNGSVKNNYRHMSLKDEQD